MKLRSALVLSAALSASLMAGCATQPATRTGASSALAASRWHARRSTLQQLDGFTLTARVAASGSYGVSGDLRWRQQGQHFALHFSGPFGAGAVDIAGTPGDVEIRMRDQHYHTDNPEAFLARNYGWTLPVTGLRYWVLGVPAPGTPARAAYDEDGRAFKLQQDGWTIAYDDYQGANGYALPRHFSMIAGKTRLRIVIDRWGDLPPLDENKG